MHVVVLTGASRGLGAALADRLLSPSRLLICVARSPNPALEQRARAVGARLDYRRCDLADAAATARLAGAIGAALRAASASATRFVLIHNAGVIEPMVRIGGLESAALMRNLQVNLAAAMVLAAGFLSATDTLGVERRILNISSGAGRNPMPGWSAYCTAKAGLDMFSRCLAAEQAGSANPARVVALAPGVLDTAMQSTIRDADEADFPSVERFRAMQAEGALASPDAVAARIVTYLDRDDFGQQVIDDIRLQRD